MSDDLRCARIAATTARLPPDGSAAQGLQALPCVRSSQFRGSFDDNTNSLILSSGHLIRSTPSLVIAFVIQHVK